MKQFYLWGLGVAVGVGLLVAGVARYGWHQPQFTKTERAAAPTLVLKGAAVQGAVLSAADGQGKPLNLKLKTAEVDPKDPAGEIYLYEVLYQNPQTQRWQNLCQPDHDGVAKALPLSGQWDNQGHYSPQGITLACTNGALAKCVRWGYKPWKTDQDIPWRDLHQTCTRMVRADYCGDGVPHTQPGVAIDIYDRLAIQQRTPQSGMTFEAAWGPEGAVAIHRTRFPTAMTQVRQQCPERLRPLPSPDANPLTLQGYAPDALIFNDSFIEPQISSGP